METKTVEVHGSGHLHLFVRSFKLETEQTMKQAIILRLGSLSRVRLYQASATSLCPLYSSCAIG